MPTALRVSGGSKAIVLPRPETLEQRKKSQITELRGLVTTLNAARNNYENALNNPEARQELIKARLAVRGCFSKITKSLGQNVPGELSLTGKVKVVYKKIVNPDDTTTLEKVSKTSKAMPPGVAVAAVFTSHEAMGALADGLQHVGGTLGNISAEIQKDIKTGAAVTTLSAFFGSLIKGVKEMLETIKKGKEYEEKKAEESPDAEELKDIQLAHARKGLETSVNFVSAADKAMKFFLYLVDKGLLHMKEGYAKVLGHLAPTFKFLGSALTIATTSIAIHRERITKSELPTPEAEISNAYKLATAIATIIVTTFTVIVKALALVVSPVIMTVLYAVMGVAHLVGAVLALHQEYADGNLMVDIDTCARIVERPLAQADNLLAGGGSAGGDDDVHGGRSGGSVSPSALSAGLSAAANAAGAGIGAAASAVTTAVTTAAASISAAVTAAGGGLFRSPALRPDNTPAPNPVVHQEGDAPDPEQHPVDVPVEGEGVASDTAVATAESTGGGGDAPADDSSSTDTRSRSNSGGDEV